MEEGTYRSMRPDDAVRDGVERALREHAGMRHPDVSVYVREGVVTLRGSVASEAPRERAAEVAGRVAGVRLVRNEIGTAEV